MSPGQHPPVKGPLWAGCKTNPRKYGPQISPRAYIHSNIPSRPGGTGGSLPKAPTFGASWVLNRRLLWSVIKRKSKLRERNSSHSARQDRAWRCLKGDDESGTRCGKLPGLASRPEDVGKQPVACGKIQMRKRQGWRKVQTETRRHCAPCAPRGGKEHGEKEGRHGAPDVRVLLVPGAVTAVGEGLVQGVAEQPFPSGKRWDSRLLLPSHSLR